MIKINYDVILFDLDGTVIDSLEGILNSLNYCFKKVGINEIDKDMLIPFIGPPIVHTLQMSYGMTEEEANNAMVFYHEYYANEGWKQFTIYDGVEELLRGLQVLGKKIGLATNKPYYYAQRIMEYKGIADCFEYIGGSNFDKGITNKKLVIEDCLEQMKVLNKDKVIMVGDRHFDVKGAKDAGVNTIGITYGYGDRKELIEAGAIIVGDTAKEILELF